LKNARGINDSTNEDFIDIKTASEFAAVFYTLYPIIAENAGMKIANQYKRTVLNRTEKISEQHNENI